MSKSNLIYNRRTKNGPSYYVTDKNTDSSFDANNTENPKCVSELVSWGIRKQGINTAES